MYSEEDLVRLWDKIKNARTTHWGEYVGLVAVPFSLDIEAFQRAHREENRRYFDTDAWISWSVPDVIASIDGLLLHHHHLTCAAENDIGGENSALCIHYWDPRSPAVRKAVGIPGINYIPDGNTREMWETIALEIY
jgi:hypothetical protein